MGVNKRYYWWKLEKRFFAGLKMKKLQREEMGHAKVVCYLKMITHCIDNSGVIEFERTCEAVEEEISIIIDEDVTLVKDTLHFLLKNSLAEAIDNGGIYFCEAEMFTGSETASAERMRKSRAGRNASQCDTDVQNGYTEKELEIEKELKKEIEKEKKKEKEKEHRVAGGDIREQPKEKKGTGAAALHSAYKDIRKKRPDYPYTEEEVKQILEFYFDYYKQAMGESHPVVTKKILDLILEKLPHCEDDNIRMEFEPENYPDVIRQHFHTEYQGDCDYQIMHFMSGPIRLLRYYETLNN